MMEEVFEALERLYKCNDDDYTLGYQQHDYKLLQQALTELKQIKEAKPSEAMEQIKTLRRFNLVELNNDENINKSLDVIEQALLKTQEFEKVSAIFKSKPFNMLYFVDEIRANIYKYSYADYKTWFIFKGGRAIKDLLTEEEFELLKRWNNEE